MKLLYDERKFLYVSYYLHSCIQTEGHFKVICGHVIRQKSNSQTTKDLAGR